MILYLRHIIKDLAKLPVILVFSFLVSCENDIEKINTIISSTSYPDVSGQKIEIIFSDSGKVQMKLTADEIKKFSRTETPYVEFPKGIDVVFFNDTLGITAQLTAGYAIYYDKMKIWEARHNVVARNFEKGEQLNSEELFWDENKGIIYSNIFSRIENKDGTFYGENGFEADQKLTRWKLKGSRGTVRFKESKPAQEQNP